MSGNGKPPYHLDTVFWRWFKMTLVIALASNAAWASGLLGSSFVIFEIIAVAACVGICYFLIHGWSKHDREWYERRDEG